MSEVPSVNLNELQPGVVIEFGSITELPEFEDILALSIEPDPTYAEWRIWRGRQHIREYLKPARFYGNLSDIRLEVMDEPYEKLVSARERGLALSTSGRVKRANDLSKETIPRYKGFIFTAEAQSTRLSSGGPVRSELWYYPSSLVKMGNKIMRDSEVRGMPFINRVLTQAEYDKEHFINMENEARSIGYQVLRNAMRHPLIQPISQ
jgi:hypothetical protein